MSPTKTAKLVAAGILATSWSGTAFTTSGTGRADMAAASQQHGRNSEQPAVYASDTAEPSTLGTATVLGTGAAGALAAVVGWKRTSRLRQPPADRRVVRVNATPALPAPPRSVEGWTGEIGATLPLCERGEARWDPLGFTAGKNADQFDAYRGAELKHGRVAMVATIGLIAQHYVQFRELPLNDGVLDLTLAPRGIGAITSYPGDVGFAILVLVTGFLELSVLSDKDRSPGDFGDPLNWREGFASTIDLATLKTYEIEHGRLAMLGVMGVFAAEYVTGYDAIQQWEHAIEGAKKLFAMTSMR